MMPNKIALNLTFTKSEIEHLIQTRVFSFIEKQPRRFEFIEETMESININSDEFDKDATLEYVTGYIEAKIIHTLYLNLALETMIVYDLKLEQFCVYKKDVNHGSKFFRKERFFT